jgi:intracellular sulfur oxidation DsrE/DsrF family protein
MEMMVDRFKQGGTDLSMAAIFHGAAGYMLLNDDAQDSARMTTTGNPYETSIARPLSEGVLIDECAATMKAEKWTNSNLLPGVKVKSGANLRIADLVQQGYVMLQP